MEPYLDRDFLPPSCPPPCTCIHTTLAHDTFTQEGLNYQRPAGTLAWLTLWQSKNTVCPAWSCLFRWQNILSCQGHYFGRSQPTFRHPWISALLGINVLSHRELSPGPWACEVQALINELLQQLLVLSICSLNCAGIFFSLQYWFCFRSVLNSMDYFSCCPNNASLQKALEAYTDFLSTTVPGAEESCRNPCQFSLVRPKTYFTMPFVAFGCLSLTPLIYNVTLRMPTTILLTESTFSYPFMTFAAELGGNT